MAKKQKPKEISKTNSKNTKSKKSREVWFWPFIVSLIIIAALVYFYPGVLPFESTGRVVQETERQTMTGAAYRFDLQFINHLQLGLPEQDVFIENPDDADEVIRAEGEDAEDTENMEKTLYAASAATEHDPFKLGENPLGPFEKGEPLEFTLGEWLAAEGSGMYSVNGGVAELKLSFRNLVPDGVYTVWCSRLTFPPNVNVVDRPCGAEDGSENSFTADDKGNADFILEMKPLEPSTKETVSVIALAYHSDGKTYGADQGDFGLTSHVHIFAIIPQPAGKPAEGWALHIDAKKHFPGNEDMIAHHHCKPVSGLVAECQLYDGDADDARLVGVEVIVSPETYNSFPDEEKALWHYHKTEIPKVEATLPDLSPEEAAQIVKSLEETYGKLYILWDPSKQDLPTGEPGLTVLE